MGTTRIKVIDLSSDQKEIKTSRKHAEKLAGFAAIEKEEKEKKEKPQIQETVETKEEVAQEEPQTQPDETKETKPQKQTKKTSSQSGKKSTHHLGKNYQKGKNQVEEKLYKKDEALELLPKISYTKFDPTVEVHFTVSEKNIKGSVALPHPFESKKKTAKILAFSEKKSEEKNIIWANEKTIDEIENGTLKPIRDFDVVYTTAKFMPALTKVAKILGPKGLMPNPKNGTIIVSPEEIKTQGGENLYEFRCDPITPVIHTKIGKLNSKEGALSANLKALAQAIGPNKIKKATLKSTMSPAIRLDVATL